MIISWDSPIHQLILLFINNIFLQRWGIFSHIWPLPMFSGQIVSQIISVARHGTESLVRCRCPYVISSHVVSTHQIQHCWQIWFRYYALTKFIHSNIIFQDVILQMHNSKYINNYILIENWLLSCMNAPWVDTQ